MSDKKITELPVASVLNLSDVSILVSGGTNYQYTFTGLLQLIASGLNVGANISFGPTLPSNATGKNGDVFIKTNSGSFAQKVAGVWTIVYTLPTTGGIADGTVLYGLGIPASALGNDNDTYINTGTGVFYKKASGAWTQVFSMQTGPQGPQGAAGTNGTNGTNGFSVLSGTSIPSNTNTGVNGDFYLNTISYTLYGPKTAGIWGGGVSLIGLGLEPGGTIGQVLTKASNNDYDLTWTTPAVIDDNIASSTKVYSSQKTSSLISNEASARAAADEELLAQIEGLQAFVNGDDIDLDTIKELANAIKANESVLDALVTGKLNMSDVYNALDRVASGKVLDARQGKVLNDLLTTLSTKVIPAGGTTGQVLAKVDGNDHNVGWVDPPAGGTNSVGFEERSFDEILTFDKNFKMRTTQTGDIAFVLGSNPIEDVCGRIIIAGDGIHECTFPNDWVNVNGQLFKKTQKNIVELEYIDGTVVYGIMIIPVPDVISPYILSATIENSAKNKIVLQYSELLDESSVPSASAFTLNLSKAVTNVNVSGSLVSITVDNDYINGDFPEVSYMPDGNPIKDLSGNNADHLVNQVILNNIDPARQSVYITANNQLLKTSVRPSNILWGGVSGDVPFSCSFWIKRNNSNSSYILNLMSESTTASPEFICYLRTVNLLEFGFVNGGAHIIRSTSAIPSNTWTHVVFTYDGTGLIGGLKMYFNGSLQAVSTPQTGYMTLTSNIPSAARLAVFGRPLIGVNDNIFNVKLCCLYFWNKQLTNSDINSLYNVGQIVDPNNLPFSASLTARYELNGNTNDTSGSSYNLSSVVLPTFAIDTP